MLSTKDNYYLPLLCGYIVSIAAVQIITVAMGLAQLPITHIGAAIMIAAALTAGYLQRRAIHGSDDDIMPNALQNTFARTVMVAIIAISSAVYIFLWISAYLRYDLTCDGNTYHIPTVQLWTQNGGICWVDPNFECSTFMNGYPKGVELIAFIVVRAFDNSHLVNTASLIFVPLGVLGICCIARLLGTHRLTAWAAGAAFVLFPVTINQSATTYVDSSYAACAIAFIALLLHTAAKLEITSVVPWRLIVPLGCAAGLAISAKSTGIVLVGGSIAIVVIFFTSKISLLPRMSAVIAASLLITILTGGYWYLRNYYHAGNPLYPVKVQLFGHCVFPGLPLEKVINPQANTPSILRQWPPPLRVLCTWLQCLWDWPQTIRQPDSRLGGLGFLWLVGCVPAIAMNMFQSVLNFKKCRMSRHVIMLTVIVVTAFLLTPMNWWARYTLWIYALGLPCLAIAADRMFSKRVGRIWLLLCITAVLLDGSVCVYDAARDTKLSPRLPLAQLNGTVFDEILAGDSAIAVGPLMSQLPNGQWKQELVGRLSLPIGQRKLFAVPQNATLENTKELTIRNVRWLIWDDTLPLPPLAATAVKKTNTSGYIVLQLVK
jgi:hypothetical protein